MHRDSMNADSKEQGPEGVSDEGSGGLGAATCPCPEIPRSGQGGKGCLVPSVVKSRGLIPSLQRLRGLWAESQDGYHTWSALWEAHSTQEVRGTEDRTGLRGPCRG